MYINPTVRILAAQFPSTACMILDITQPCAGCHCLTVYKIYSEVLLLQNEVMDKKASTHSVCRGLDRLHLNANISLTYRGKRCVF